MYKEGCRETGREREVFGESKGEKREDIESVGRKG